MRRQKFEYQPEHGGHTEGVQTWYSMEGVDIRDACDDIVGIDYEDIPKLIIALQQAYNCTKDYKEKP